MANPFTPAQFKFLEAAFDGRLDRRTVTGGKWRTSDKLSREGLVEWVERRCVLTTNGLRAYVDMCERRDADSGCMAYQQRAAEARAALAARQVPA